MVKEAITSTIAKHNIYTVNKTEKSQAPKGKIYRFSSNKYDKGKSLDKSRSTKITWTEYTLKSVNKSRSISSDSSFEKSTKIEKNKEIDISKYNSSLYGMSGHGESLSSITPYQKRITSKNKRKKTSESSITKKESIQGSDNPNKMSKGDNIPDVGKLVKKHPHRLKIRKTTLMILTGRLVGTVILQVKLMVVQETLANKTEIKRKKNSVKITPR